MSRKVDCKGYLEQTLDKYKELIAQEGLQDYSLTVITVGNDPAALAYNKGKQKDFEHIGAKLNNIFIDTSEPGWIGEVTSTIDDCSDSAKCAGIMVEFDRNLKLSPAIQQSMFNCIAKTKDIDGLGEDSLFMPCTAEGVKVVLKNILQVDLRQHHICVLGRSRLVGKPIINMLIDEGATITCCNSRTSTYQRKESLRGSSIIISAVGKPNLVEVDDTRCAGYVIDIGTTVGEDGKLHGDVDPRAYEEDNPWKPAYYTAVPGGMGLITRAVMVQHFYTAAKFLAKYNKEIEKFCLQNCTIGDLTKQN